MGVLKPEHPQDAGVPREIPDQSHIEGAELLANQARPRLRKLGFNDQEILEWAETYIAEEGSGDLESLLIWIREREA